MKKLRIQQVRSTIGRLKNQHDNIVALGIKKMNGVVVHDDTPQVRGMIKKVFHLVNVTEINE